MKSAIKLVVVIMILALTASGTACNSGPVSQCEGLKIARTQLPARFSDSSAIITLSVDEENKEIWRVLFPVVEITFAVLGWERDANQYFVAATSTELELEMPEGVYLNVVIYIDAETGEVTGLELNNKIILGHPDMYAECD